MKQIDIQTNNKSEMIEITSIVQKAVSKEKVVTGICVIFAPHTTAAITINENADPDVPRDIIAHMEGNSAAHVKSTFVGSSQVVLIENSRLVLGTWQSIFFCEFDVPRTRKILINVICENGNINCF